MNARSRVAVRLLGTALLVAMVIATGCSALQEATSRSGALNSGAVAPVAPESVPPDGGAAAGYGASAESVDTASSQAVPEQTLVITNAAMGVEVKDLDASVAAIRALATRYGGSISNLSTSAGSDSAPVPVAADGSSAEYTVPTPGGATITLRIPAAKLPAAEKDVAALGRVTSQSSSQDDVTQQHVDMKARLKNLQAEEARLRTFFLKAKRVSEMLAIEQELARVRGDIESMTAQITYLERQAALATLTISLSQPGTLVSPAAGGWGFSAAIRDGVRAAAAVTRGLITTLLALSPVILMGVVLVLIIRAMVLRRRKRRAAGAAEQGDSGDATAESETQQ